MTQHVIIIMNDESMYMCVDAAISRHYLSRSLYRGSVDFSVQDSYHKQSTSWFLQKLARALRYYYASLNEGSWR